MQDTAQPDHAAADILGQGRFLRLVRRDDWEFVERCNATAIVALVPLTDEGSLVFVEQYRPPHRARVIEFPAGLVGDLPHASSEDLASAARRELLEETGYTATTLRRIAAGPPSAGQSTEVVTFFLATGLRRTGAGGGDHTEDIVVHVVPLATTEDWLVTREAAGCLIDPKVYAGLFFAERSLAGKLP